MLVDGIRLIEGSNAENLVIDTGTSFPASPDQGELFYRSDLTTLYVYNASTWTPAAGSSSYTITGDVAGTLDGGTDVLTLANVNGNVGSFGTASAVATVTANAKGLITAVSNTSIQITESQITDGSILARLAGNETISGSWTFSNVVVGVDPTLDAHLATKSYVDSVATGLDVKTSVRAATTANITLSGAQTIDGVSVVAGNRVLVKNQSTGADNGIYVAAAGAWSRATDADNSPAGEVTSGMFTFVTEGTTNGDFGWVLTTDDPITLGSTSLTFTQFSNAGGGGGVTSVNVSGGTTGLTTTGGPITTSGTITLTGTLAATNGGTAQSTWATGDILYASATDTLTKRTIGTAGQVLTVSGGIPTWVTPGVGSTASTLANATTFGTVTNTAQTLTGVAGTTSGTSPMTITASTTSTGAGSSLTLNGGPAGTTVGGNLNLNAGTSVAGAGANVSIAASAAAGTGAGGTMAIVSGAGSTTGAGGAFTMTTGAGAGAANGGAFTFTAGNSGAGATGNGGAITIDAGDAASTNGAGGAFNVTSGTGSGSGNGGAFNLTAGNAGATGTGGVMTISAGNSGAGATGTSGSLNLNAGDSAATNGAGGAIAISSGNGTGTGVGGAVTIDGGTSSGSGAGGNIILTSGGTTSNATGSLIQLNSGNGVTTGGKIILDTGTGTNHGDISLRINTTEYWKIDGVAATVGNLVGTAVSAGSNTIRSVDGLATGPTMTLRGGNTPGAGTGGAVTASGGTSTTGFGGAATLSGGNGAGGGNVTISAGTSASTAGATVTISASSATGTGIGGDITMTTGNAASTSRGGNFTITLGTGGTSSGTGGSFSLTAGSAVGSAAGGAITLIGGQGIGGNISGGAVTITGGTSNIGLGGAVNLTGGVTPQTGAVAATASSITISAGATNADTGGIVTISTTGGATTGGKLILRTGTGGTAGGDISIRLNTAGTTEYWKFEGTNANLVATQNNAAFNVVRGENGTTGFPMAMRGGDGSAGVGGALALRGGDGTTTGGAVSLLAGTSGSGAGQAITITASAGGTGAVAGGAVSLSAGNSGSGATGNGGAITITAGSAASTTGSGGSLNLRAGNGNSAAAGDVILTSGSGTTSNIQFRVNNNGSPSWSIDTTGNLVGNVANTLHGLDTTTGIALTVRGGDGTTGTGGAATFRAGDNTTTSGTGGALTIRSGNGQTTGGAFTIQGSTGGTTGGSIVFQTAATTTLATRMTIVNGGGVTIAAPSVGSAALTASGDIRATTDTATIGYLTGGAAGGAVTQVTSRATGVTLNKITGAITLVSAAGSATPTSFTVTNSKVATNDVIILNQQTGTDLYHLLVTNVTNGSFKVTAFTTGGTTSESPVINFAVIKGSAN